MVREAIKTARTIEEARSAALLELGLSEEDDFKVEVLKIPTKKIFGLFGGSLAEVRVFVELRDEEPGKKEAERGPGKKGAEPRLQKKAAEKRRPEKKPPEKKALPDKKEEKPETEQAEKEDALKETDEYREAEDYISGVVKGLGLEMCDVRTRADEEQIVFELNCGDDYGIVIGRRGETLDAIQYLARMVVSRRNPEHRRVSLNVGNFRERRANALVSLAKRSAVRAVRTGRNITLEPMNPYERRVIHTAVHEVEGATSFSVGQGLDRRVIIAPEGGAVSRAESAERSYERRGGRRGDRRPKREPYIPQIAPDREQKRDAAGVARYNKVEVKKDRSE